MLLTVPSSEYSWNYSSPRFGMRTPLATSYCTPLLLASGMLGSMSSLITVSDAPLSTARSMTSHLFLVVTLLTVSGSADDPQLVSFLLLGPSSPLPVGGDSSRNRSTSSPPCSRPPAPGVEQPLLDVR